MRVIPPRAFARTAATDAEAGQARPVHPSAILRPTSGGPPAIAAPLADAPAVEKNVGVDEGAGFHKTASQRTENLSVQRTKPSPSHIGDNGGRWVIRGGVRVAGRSISRDWRPAR